jgi:hypothetical protein
MTTISDDRLAERGVEVLKRISASRMPLADASFIAQWVHDARQSLRAQGGVRVKPLGWSDHTPPTAGISHYDHCISVTTIGEYRIEWKGWKQHGGYCVYGPEQTHIETAENLDAAKAAAQADYERRIRGSLEASPAPVSEEWVEAEKWCRIAGKAMDALDAISCWEASDDELEEAAGQMTDFAEKAVAEVRAMYRPPALAAKGGH